jgi:hypothetical protein
MLELQQFMRRRDWVQLGVLVAVSAALWTWVWVEYRKPIVDPAWYATVTASRDAAAPPAGEPY